MYRVLTDEQVQQQLDTLPADALTAFAELRTVLEVNPWSGEPAALSGWAEFVAKGLVRKNSLVKVLGNGELEGVKLDVTAAGGTANTL